MWITDGYSNLVGRFAATFNSASGTGTPRDQSQYGRIKAPIYLSDREKHWLYENSKIIQNVVEVLPNQYLASFIGWDFPGVADIDVALAEDFTDWLEEKKVFDHIHDALILGNLSGDGYLVFDLDDNQDPSQPVGETAINDLVGAKAFEQDELTPENLNTMNPEFYRLNYVERDVDFQFENSVMIHKSRLIRIPGIKIRGRSHGYHHGKNNSVLQTIVQDFMNWDASKSDIRNMLSSSSMLILSKNGLGQALKSDENGVFQRLTSLMLGLNVMKLLAVDGNSEKLDIASRNFSNIDKLLNALTELLISATGLPRYKLLGTTVSSNFSDSGVSERMTYEGLFSMYIKVTLRPVFTQLVNICKQIQTCPIFGLEDRIVPKFKSTFELDPFEKVRIYKEQAEGDRIYKEMGVLDNFTIGMSRFGGDSLGMEIRIEDESYFDGLQEQDTVEEQNNGSDQA